MKRSLQGFLAVSSVAVQTNGFFALFSFLTICVGDAWFKHLK
ncbi:hypothetical protein N646_3424 [Vibrio alginolyticus NBRC 15630 = ATCC 17749]|uniref:Uncharacterized protein n=1 Tax=Vibrio alginolyticus (strain ATCC 17749 / DSM 2171 / NBRC 15630 / NCIMB 1903 / NCTC 12160 / XII-53) TaxID=1219076 RepID=A0A2I3CL31_VIBAX|nr:hypothetical protein N646_3424 [Vibrio alginolyticus NBRC 15630 = ATCC 17749]